MEFGASIFFTDYSITPAELAVAMEERGFGSVWAAEHSHIPVPGRTRADSELGKRYYDVMDPFVTLTAAACATKRLKIATGHLPCDPARHDPDRQACRLARSRLGRAFPVRHRWRMEPGGD
jgi:alkanesulfonate monooxygenase SsuD/methylene tetrahydromethanopterin reductase-like flavin-dependent oxidoreductase (luciferase family)